MPQGNCVGCAQYFVRLEIHYGRNIYCKRKLLTSKLPQNPATNAAQIDHGLDNDLLFEDEIEQPLSDELHVNSDDDEDEWAPFNSKQMLEMAYWHVYENSTAKSRERMTRIGVYSKSGTQCMKSTQQMNELIDSIPQFHPALDSGEWKSTSFGNCARIYGN